MKHCQLYKVDQDYIVLQPDGPVPPPGTLGYAASPQGALLAYSHFLGDDPIRPNEHASPGMIRDAGLPVYTELSDAASPRFRVVCQDNGRNCPHLVGLFRRKFPMVVGQLGTRYPATVTYSGIPYRLEAL